jgi:multidrug efflux pump subunit AcrB
MAARFRRVLVKALANRGWVVIGTAGAFVIAVVLFGFVQQQFFPSSSRPELMIDLRLAQNASIKATEAEVRRFEKVLLADKDIVYHSFYVGSGAVRFYLPLNQQLENANFAQAVVITRSYEVRDAVRARLEKVLNEEFSTLMARVEPLALGPPVDWPLQYRVSGPDVSGVRAIAGTVAATLRENPNTRVVQFRLERDDQAHAHRRRPGEGAAVGRQFRNRCRVRSRRRFRAAPSRSSATTSISSTFRGARRRRTAGTSRGCAISRSPSRVAPRCR